jgi:hypothetical protein
MDPSSSKQNLMAGDCEEGKEFSEFHERFLSTLATITFTSSSLIHAVG